MTLPHVRVAAYRPARRRDRESGLLAYLALELDGALRIEDVTLRRTWEGRWTLAFPRHVDRDGHRFDLVHPISSEARDRIEQQVFAQLGIEGPWVATSTRSDA